MPTTHNSYQSTNHALTTLRDTWTDAHTIAKDGDISWLATQIRGNDWSSDYGEDIPSILEVALYNPKCSIRNLPNPQQWIHLPAKWGYYCSNLLATAIIREVAVPFSTADLIIPGFQSRTTLHTLCANNLLFKLHGKLTSSLLNTTYNDLPTPSELYITHIYNAVINIIESYKQAHKTDIIVSNVVELQSSIILQFDLKQSCYSPSPLPVLNYYWTPDLGDIPLF